MNSTQTQKNIRLTLLRFFLNRLQSNANRGSISNLALVGLSLCWGNLFYSAGWRYLRQVVKHTLASDNDILECGSGLTTVIIGALTADTQRKVVVLEHNPSWLMTVENRMAEFNIGHINLLFAPLVRYGTYSWYSTPVRFFEENTFGLIVCDGPPSSTTGGRFGLIPKITPYLASECTILLDDTHRQSEKRILKMWQQKVKFQLREHRSFISRCSALFIQRAE